jgi:glyoxylase-like metal-dependent hydrolase (beta-lactamase superfamily II)
MIELATGIRYLGTVGMPPTTAIYLATDGEESCIIEPGPNSGSDTVIRLVNEAGVDSVNKIVATHIHLDHAGASRALLDRYNGSMLYLYKGAAKYLIDTAQLEQSARQVLGQLFDIWGGIPAVPQDRMIEVVEGDSIPVGSLRLRIIYTPGHAPYHMSVFEENTRILHTGDAVGMYIKNRKTLWPASPLPSFRYDMEMQSLHKIISLNPHVLMIPHYGPVTEVKEFLDMNLQVYETWHQVLSVADDNIQVEDAARRLVKAIDSYSWIPDEPHFWFTLKMHVAGFLDYERKSIEKKDNKRG